MQMTFAERRHLSKNELKVTSHADMGGEKYMTRSEREGLTFSRGTAVRCFPGSAEAAGYLQPHSHVFK